MTGLTGTTGTPLPQQTLRGLGSRSWWTVTAAILGVALVLRICNLGSFSLWLDEVITMRFSALPLPRILAASAGDAENVPVYLIASHIARWFGLDDPWIRLPSILAGLAAILLLMLWTRRHFGSEVAVITGAFCALSPFHVRYSQELRAYPYLLLMVPLTLLAGDRLRHRPDLRATAGLAGTIALGFYTHLTYMLVIPPLLGLVLVPAGSVSRGARWQTVLGRLALATALGVAAFLPWLFLITQRLGERMTRGGVKPWTLDRIGERWHAFTVAPWQPLDIGWLGLVFGVFGLLGIWVAARHPIGRAVLLMSLPTLVVWEAALVAMDHWTAARYDTTLWPFLAVLIALGIHSFLGLLRLPLLQGAVAVLLAVAVLFQVDAYLAVGRPRWEAIGQAIELVQRPGEPILALNQETRGAVTYYVRTPVRSIDGSARQILRALNRHPSVLLVYGSWRRSPQVLRLAHRQTLLLRVVQRPFDAELYRITAGVLNRVPLTVSRESRPTQWPEPAADLIPESLGRRAPSFFMHMLRAALPQPEWSTRHAKARMEPELFANRGSGWSPVRAFRNGLQYRWVTGREASLEIRREPVRSATVRIRLWPPRDLADRQVMRLLLNDHEVATRSLRRRRQTISVDTPPGVWRSGRNLLVLQFRETERQGNARLPWQGPPPRAAAVAWVEVRPVGKRVDSRADLGGR